MKPGSIVIVNLCNPVERLLGRLLEVSVPGLTIRGLDLGAFEDWINDVRDGEAGVSPSTMFVPMHRVEKVMMDEGLGGSPSLSDTFLRRVGASLNRHLEGE